MAKRATKAKAKGTAATPARKAKAAPRRAIALPKAESDAADVMATAVAAVTRALSAHELDALPQRAVQQLMAAVVRAYSAKVQAGEAFLPYDDRTGRVSPTDVMITASGLLKAADLQVFELGMWQSYTGR